MVDVAELQVQEITQLSFESLTCTVRCLTGVVRIDDPVLLVSRAGDGPILEGLTVAGIWRHVDLSFVDRGMTARVTVAGAVDVAAVRAATVGVPRDELWRLDLRLVAG